MSSKDNLNISNDMSGMDLYRQKLFARYEEHSRAAQPVLEAKKLRIMLCGCDKENYPSGLQCSCNFGEYEQFSLEELQVMYAKKLKEP